MTTEEIVEVLKTHCDTLQKIALLEYELKQPARVTAIDMIETLAMSHGNGTICSAGTISNKTPYAAESYQEATDAANAEIVYDLASRLFALKKRTERLTYYLSLLDEKEQCVIRLHYFERFTLQQIADRQQLSMWTVRKLRKDAVEHLAFMCSYIESYESGSQ